MEKFAGYGFNKSHAAAYALVAYQTAWLKAHYPAEFMAAVMTSEMQNTDNVVFLIDDCRINGSRSFTTLSQYVRCIISMPAIQKPLFMV